MLDSLKSIKKTIGVKQSLKAVENGEAKVIIIAEDAEERVVFNITELCKKNQIEIKHIETMKQLGKACGIDVGASVVCILK